MTKVALLSILHCQKWTSSPLRCIEAMASFVET